MDDQRPSGRWDSNADSDMYEPLSPTRQTAPEGPYKYYQPPRHTSQEQKRTFSERSTGSAGINGQNETRRADSQRQRPYPATAAEAIVQHFPETTSEQLAQTKHINSSKSPPSSPYAPISIDPDFIPENLRTKAWSPAPMSPPAQQPGPSRPKPRQVSQASNTSEPMRRGSVSGRSPLQKLEVRTKEEKRALLEEAEHRARQNSLSTRGEGEAGISRQSTVRSEKSRAVSDGLTRRTSEPRKRTDRPRQLSAGAPSSPADVSATRSPTTGLTGFQRFQLAQEALRKETSPPKEASRSAKQQFQDPPRAREAKPYEPATEVTRGAAPIERPRQVAPAPEPAKTSTDLDRTNSGKYRHRARDAGFAGAAAAFAASANAPLDAGAQRGKDAHERRKSLVPNDPPAAAARSVSPEQDRTGLGIARGGSKRIQKRTTGNADAAAEQQMLQSDRVGTGNGRKERQAAEKHLPPDPVPRESVENSRNEPVKYSIPPQTAAGQLAKEQVGFGEVVPAPPHSADEKKHRRFGDLFHRHDREHWTYQDKSKPLDEWKHAVPVRLTLSDLEFEDAAAKAGATDAPWWEKGRRASASGPQAKPNLSQYDGPYEEQSSGFTPFVFLKCGPLLRYTGIRKEAYTSSRTGKRADKEVWRGSIMIVTEDDQSDISAPPTLRLFAQPMDLHQLPPRHTTESTHDMHPEADDPVAGQVKLSRTGRALYVRPVHDIDGLVDLSREENPEGLYDLTRTPVLGPQSITGPDGRQNQHIAFQDKSRIKKRDGEKAGRYRDVKATRLHTERNTTFWRFNIEIELGSKQHRVAYRINKGPAIGFWVPARGETMNIMFHSCNGFSLSVDSNTFSGPDPLWRDVMNRHQSRPFHVMIGGGDQVYNDAATRQTQLFREWLQMKNPEHKHRAEFSPEMQEELEEFYLERYAMWFSQGMFGMANSQIPMVNIWDDHDIIDGYGSYPHHFMSSRVFTGLGAVAFKYYMLFQHQSVVAETEREEPSWLLGKSPGPYINELSRSVLLSLGPKVSFLGLDCRTERMRDEILSQETYDLIFDRLHHELVKGETKHLIVLLGVPIAYPRLNFLENILTSRAMDPIKAIGRTGMLGGFVNKFDGGVEILDDLDDHWTAKHHKGERNWFIRELQDLAAEKSMRITLLGGDVHLAAVGQFYSNKKLGIAKDRDHRYMPNIISSAIVNTPPPTMMADVLNKRNKVHHLDSETDEDMIPMFDHDVDGAKRNNTHLLPRRNFCTIREFIPGSTPPATPLYEPQTPASASFGPSTGGDGTSDRRFPPGSMKRTRSLTRGTANLVRRLSGGGKSRNPPLSLGQNQSRPAELQRANSLGSRPPTADGGSYFPPDSVDTAPARPGFHRRPTNLSIKEARKAAAKGGADGAEDGQQEPGHVDLEHGLDISLCMEVDQRDPGGSTVPYRLLVPALKYESPTLDGGDDGGDLGIGRKKRISLMDRLWRNRQREEPGLDGAYHEPETFSDEGDEDNDDDDRPATAAEKEKHRADAAVALGLTSTGRGASANDDAAAAAAAAATDGRHAPIPAHNNHPAAAYDKGFNLNRPPIGTFAHPSPPLQERATGQVAYPASGYRRVSGPAQRGGPPSPTQSEGSLTLSDDDSGGAPPARNRANRAEQFFGTTWSSRRPPRHDRPADDPPAAAGEAAPQDGPGRMGSVKKKPAWMIWK